MLRLIQYLHMYKYIQKILTYDGLTYSIHKYVQILYSSFSLKLKQLWEAELFLPKENHCFVKPLKLCLIWKTTSFWSPMCLVS
jgi:hypothetical protein